jgi:hypothetical protein
MLTDGNIAQDWLIRHLSSGARAPEIARALAEVSPHAWKGGLVDRRAWSLLVARGPWAAEFKGANGCLHYVVVDGVTPDGLVRIRDPFGGGSVYLMTQADFRHVWDGVALFRDDPPSGIPVVRPDSGETPAPPAHHPPRDSQAAS